MRYYQVNGEAPLARSIAHHEGAMDELGYSLVYYWEESPLQILLYHRLEAEEPPTYSYKDYVVLIYLEFACEAYGADSLLDITRFLQGPLDFLRQLRDLHPKTVPETGLIPRPRL